MVQIGFNRDKFAERAEKTFDKTFDYERPVHEKYSYLKDMVKNPEKAMLAIIHAPKTPKDLARRMVNQITKDSEVVKAFNKIPKNKQQLKNKVIDKSVDAVAMALKLNPKGLTVTVAKKIVKKTINTAIPSMTKPYDR